MTLRRRTALVALTAACAATAAAPALAADETEQVKVSLNVAVGGFRQFDALDESAETTLKRLDLGTTGTKAFRTRVKDENFEALGKSYSVTATMSNLYRRTGIDTATDTTTNDVATKIESKNLSLGNGTPYTTGPLVGVVPQLSVGGTLKTCADGDIAGILGITDLTAVLTNLLDPLNALCTELSTGTQTVTGPVDGALQTVQATINDLAKLPTIVTNTLGTKTFLDADYAHDATALTEPSAVRTASPATAVTVMQGQPATSLSAADLLAEVDTLLTAKAATLPVTGTGGLVPLTSLRGLITDTGLRAAVTDLDDAKEVALLNTLTSAVVTVADPVLSRLRLTTNVYAKPTLNAALTAPVSGIYDGTLTLTFVQT